MELQGLVSRLSDTKFRLELGGGPDGASGLLQSLGWAQRVMRSAGRWSLRFYLEGLDFFLPQYKTTQEILRAFGMGGVQPCLAGKGLESRESVLANSEWMQVSRTWLRRTSGSPKNLAPSDFQGLYP